MSNFVIFMVKVSRITVGILIILSSLYLSSLTSPSLKGKINLSVMSPTLQSHFDGALRQHQGCNCALCSGLIQGENYVS